MQVVIQVALPLGTGMADGMVEGMLPLALRTGATVESKVNGIRLVVQPNDTEDKLRDAFNRLYPHSTVIATHLTAPVPAGRDQHSPTYYYHKDEPR